MSTLKLSFTTLACPEWDIPTILSKAMEYEYDGIDFRGYADQVDLRKRPEFTSRLAETVRQVEESGLAVSGVSSSAHMFDADPKAAAASLQEVRDYAELCQAFRAPFLRVFGGALGGASFDEAIPKAADFLNRLSEIATKAGITAVVETHDAWVRTEPLLRAFNASGYPPNVFVLWDVNHPYRIAHETVAETCANIGRLTRYTHWKDSSALPDGGHKLMRFGEGTLPLADFFAALKGVGYDGWHVLEWEKRWHKDIADADIALPDFIRVMRKLDAATR